MVNAIDRGLNGIATDKDKAIVGYISAGGQMGVAVNTTDLLYKSKEVINGGYANNKESSLSLFTAANLNTFRAEIKGSKFMPEMASVINKIFVVILFKM